MKINKLLVAFGVLGCLFVGLWFGGSALWGFSGPVFAGEPVTVRAIEGCQDCGYGGPIRNLIQWLRDRRPRPQPPVPPPDPPTPEPQPPTPPEPQPKPIPVTGFKVLLTGDGPRDVARLTPDQVAILSSRTFRDWLQSNKGEIRIIAKSSIIPGVWQDMLAMAPTGKPSLVAVAPNKPPLVTDLPANTQQTIDKLAAYLSVRSVQVKPVVTKGTLREFTEEEWKQFTSPDRVVIFNGEKRYLSVPPRDLKKRPYGSAPGAVGLQQAGVDIIPRSEWPGRIAALKAANAGLMALTYGKVRCSDQDGLGYCWAHSVKNGAEMLFYQQGFPYAQLSAVSIGGPITGYRNQGGWPADALAFMVKKGAVTTALWPENDLRSSYYYRSDVQAEYPKYRVEATIADLGASGRMFDECASCVLLGAPVAVSYNWWGHAVVMVGLELKNGVYYGVFRNSWGSSYGDDGFFLMREGSGSNRATPDDAQALLMMKGF